MPGRTLVATAALLVALAIASPAAAFCGFYVSGADAKLFNNATQVVLLREGTRTVLSMQNNYQGPPEDFAMVVPVPVVLQKENVKTLKREVFTKIDQLDAPRLVEYWEADPCAPAVMQGGPKGGGAVRAAAPAKAPAAEKKDLGVTIEAQFTVGEYEIVILSAKDSAGLETWLKQEKYKIPEGSEPYLRPYVQAGSKFFVARVDMKKVTFDEKKMATLSPLRFHYDSDQFSLPVRLGLVNSGGTQDLIVHILAKRERFEVANYPNVTIPTNLDVSENAREGFGSFYASLFDRTLEKSPKAVVTEYAWDAGTCDPCPGPALSGDDLATLGADVLASAKPPSPPTAPSGFKMQGGGAAPAPPSRPPRPGGRVFMPSLGFVLTRLHARYAKDALGEDLVFRTAPAIVGGRENRSAEGALEHGATPSSVNNFQGRYAIRHPWGGPIACKEPKRGVWGGPPTGQEPTAGGGPKPALGLAFVARDAKLPAFVVGEIPELGVKGEGAPVSATLPKTSPSGAASDETTAPSPDAPDKAAKQDRRGCLGCASSTVPETVGDGALLLVVGLALRRRRSRSAPIGSAGSFRA